MTKELQVSFRDRELFKSGWSEAKKILSRIYPKGLPENHEMILDDLYKIRTLYVREGNAEQLVGQQKEFMNQYGDQLDKSLELNLAVRMITMLMGRN